MGTHEVEDNLAIREALVGGNCYVVCRNPIEQRKDGAACEAVLAKLNATLQHQGPKAVIGNKGFARFIRVAKGAVTVNEEAVEADARLDGRFVLRTSTDLLAGPCA